MDPTISPEVLEFLTNAPMYIVLTIILFSMIALIIWLIRRDMQESKQDGLNRTADASTISQLILSIRDQAREANEATKSHNITLEHLTKTFEKEISLLQENTIAIQRLGMDNNETRLVISEVRQSVADVMTRFGGRLDNVEAVVANSIEINRQLIQDIKDILGGNKE